MSRYYLLLILLLYLPAHAEIYKWVDAQGKVHYSDQPVEGAQAVELEPNPAVSSSAGPSTEEINRRIEKAHQKLGAERKQEARLQAREAKREKSRQKKDKKTCQYYRDKLANLEYRWDLQTTRKGYKESQKTRFLAKKDQYQRDIKRHCN